MPNDVLPTPALPSAMIQCSVAAMGGAPRSQMILIGRQFPRVPMCAAPAPPASAPLVPASPSDSSPKLTEGGRNAVACCVTACPGFLASCSQPLEKVAQRLLEVECDARCSLVGLGCLMQCRAQQIVQLDALRHENERFTQSL